MKFYFIFLFLFLLVFTPTISAQPPFIQPTQPFVDGYIIEIPEQEILKVNQDFNFFFHVFNISNGLPLTDSLVNCEFNLHDSTSKLIFTDNSLFFDDTTTAFNVTIGGGNFTTQDYTYVTHCNSTDFGGFISVAIKSTPDGKESVAFPQQFSVIALGIILVMFGILRSRYNLLKHMGSLVLMVMGILTLYPGYNNISHTTLFGLALGSSLIGIGFYFLIEDSFSREEQEGKFEQPQGSTEEEEER